MVNLDIFPLISLSDIVSINLVTLDTEIYRSVCIKRSMTLPIKTKKNVSFEGLDIHYHSSSYQTRRYSILLYLYIVKPVLRGHLWNKEKWPYKTGDLLNEIFHDRARKS